MSFTNPPHGDTSPLVSCELLPCLPRESTRGRRVRGRGTQDNGWLLQFGKAIVNSRRRACGRTSGAPDDNRKGEADPSPAPQRARLSCNARAMLAFESASFGTRMSCCSSGRQHTEKRRAILRLGGRAAKNRPRKRRGHSARMTTFTSLPLARSDPQRQLQIPRSGSSLGMNIPGG